MIVLGDNAVCYFNTMNLVGMVKLVKSLEDSKEVKQKSFNNYGERIGVTLFHGFRLNQCTQT